MKKFKKILPNLLLGAIFLIGFMIFAYPTVSDQWNKYHQSMAIASYDRAVEDMSEEDYSSYWEAAEQFNSTIAENTFTGDAFSNNLKDIEDTEYYKILNVGGSGIMGYISIPKIKQKLPIYHGTVDTVLQIGVGHLAGTKLPIGGSGNHSVLAAHRGLPSAKLFSDLDKMKKGDKFYIHILDQVFAYEVSSIDPMVDKEDTTTLEGLLQIQEGEDLVTLFTCTPYGVNSHRLLVHGSRCEYHGEDDEKVADETMLESIQEYYMLYGLLAAAILLLLFFIYRTIKRRKVKNLQKPLGKVQHPRREKDEKDKGE